MDINCNHDFNSDNHTLSLLEWQVMTNPRKYFTVCKNCGEPHTFTIKNGVYIEKGKKITKTKGEGKDVNK